MKTALFLYTLLMSILLAFNGVSQTQVHGHVIDDLGEEVIGANVFIKDSYDGTSTDVDGSFKFSTFEEGSRILVVTYIGFKDGEVAVELDGNPVNIQVRLHPTAANLKEIVISAGAFEAGDEKKGVVMSSLDIVTTAGAAGDIAGALNTLPGTQTVGETGQLFVRGGAASETKTFIDGQRVQNPYTASVPDVPSRGRFSPFLFKGTLFSTGGYSAEYGQALSSALILNTTDVAEETTSSVSLMSIGGGLAHTQAWERSSVSVSANYVNLGPYINLVPQEREWEDPFQSGDGQAIFRYKTSETGILKVHATYTGSGLKFEYADPVNIGQTNTLRLQSSNFYINSTYHDVLGEKWAVRLGTSYSDDREEVEELFYVDTKERVAQTKLTLTHYLNDHVTLRFGGEYLYNHFDESFIDRENQSFPSLLKDHYVAGFVESDIYFSRRLALKIGGRLEHTSIIDQWNVAPRVSLALKTGPKSQVSFALGKFYQTPINDLLKFNTGLTYENATHYIINYQRNKDNRIFRVEGYYKTYDDLVKYDTNEQWLSDNSGSGYARGIDVFFRDRKTIGAGDYWISYSFLDTERTYLDYPTSATPYFASKHNLSIVYKHWFSKLSSAIGLTYSYTSGRPYNDPNVAGFNTGQTKAFQDLSMNLSYLTNIKKQFTVIFATISNIPGFDNTFGYRFAPTPDNDGTYPSYAVKPDAKRFFFVGMFISIGQTFNKEEQIKPD